LATFLYAAKQVKLFMYVKTEFLITKNLSRLWNLTPVN